MKFITRKDLADTERIDALNLLSRDLTFIEPVRAADYANEALQLSLKIDYQKGTANGYRILASIFSSHNKSIIAEEYLQKAMAIFSSINDSVGIANCYITRGHIFRRMENRREEVEYHRRAFEIFSRLQLPSRVAVAAHNLGESYYNTGDFQKSRELTLFAIGLNDSLSNMAVLSNCYKVMGKLERVAGNTNAAEDNFKKVLTISETLGPYSQKIAVIESFIELAALYKNEGKNDLSLGFLKQAALFCDKNQLSVYLRIVYSELIKYHAGQPDQVLYYINEFDSVSVSVAARLLKTEKLLQEYGIKVYEFLEAEDRRIEKKLILQEHRVKNRNRWLIVSVTSALILSILLVLLLRTLRKQKKAESGLKEKSEKLRELAAYLQNIREDERIRMASDIHEGLGQQLIVLKMDIAWLEGKLSNENEKVVQRVAEISSLLDTTVTAIRKIAIKLRPGVLDDIGLNTAIKWQLAEFEKEYGIKTEFRGPTSDELFTRELKTALFRILQDTISNVGHHSNAKHLDVHLQLKKDIAVLTITDDGIGFDSTSAETKRKFGILSMQERCYMIGGDFELHSTANTGTTIIIKAPIVEKKDESL